MPKALDKKSGKRTIFYPASELSTPPKLTTFRLTNKKLVANSKTKLFTRSLNRRSFQANEGSPAELENQQLSKTDDQNNRFFSGLNHG